jgi:hypothetical protein
MRATVILYSVTAGLPSLFDALYPERDKRVIK